MPRNYNAKDIASWKFQDIDLPDEWARHLGDIVENFRMIIEGPPGHGKTEYLLQLSKVLARTVGKVSINNVEQGKAKSLKQAVIRNGLLDLNQERATKGKWMLADKSQRNFDTWFKKLQRPNSGRIIALDSIDYMHLTFDQFKQLHERFPHKALIVVCWNDPIDLNSKKIRYLCDIKVTVKNYIASVRSRFGGNEDYVIWQDQVKHKSQLKIEYA